MLVALTGGLGCGKSTVLELFRDLGARTVSADRIVHELLESQEVKEEIRRLFGSGVFGPDGTVDRKRLAKYVFQKEPLRKELEGILHPLVYKKILEMHQKEPQKVMIAEIPLLFETGSQGLFDKVITVYAPQKIARDRLRARGMQDEDIDARLRSQIPIETKVEKADFVIDNSGDMELTRKQVEEVFSELVEEVSDS